MTHAFAFAFILSFSTFAFGATPKTLLAQPQSPRLKLGIESPLTFDIPVDYNREVKGWIKYFQGSGRQVFSTWLKRSHRFLPAIQETLARENLPLDLAYIAMIESGFSHSAVSHANAVGPWQFISETGQRYGLQIDWWIDERKDFDKSTKAAAKYLRYLHKLFGTWYLAAAGYNTGENRIRRLVDKHGTKNFWTIAKRGGFHIETKDYIPKLIATMLIAKAPQLYGFRDVKALKPLEFEHFRVPGGTNLNVIAERLRVPNKELKDLNPELIKGFIPHHVTNHLIRVPKGAASKLSAMLRQHTFNE